MGNVLRDENPQQMLLAQAATTLHNLSYNQEAKFKSFANHYYGLSARDLKERFTAALTNGRVNGAMTSLAPEESAQQHRDALLNLRTEVDDTPGAAHAMTWGYLLGAVKDLGAIVDIAPDLLAGPETPPELRALAYDAAKDSDGLKGCFFEVAAPKGRNILTTVSYPDGDTQYGLVAQEPLGRDPRHRTIVIVPSDHTPKEALDWAKENQLANPKDSTWILPDRSLPAKFLDTHIASGLFGTLRKPRTVVVTDEKQLHCETARDMECRPDGSKLLDHFAEERHTATFAKPFTFNWKVRLEAEKTRRHFGRFY